MKRRKKKPAPRKKVKKQPLFAPEKPENIRSLQGFMLLAFSLILFLSLVSFGRNAAARNSLGELGDLFGFAFTAVFGVSSYILCAFFAWLGWRLLFRKPINRLPHKILHLGLLIFSMNMLLSLIEDRFYTLNRYIGDFFFYAQWHKGFYFHPGGAPIYFLFRDLPSLNFLRMFNTTGIIIIFSTTMAASLLYLLKIHPSHLVRSLSEAYSGWKERRARLKPSAVMEPIALAQPGGGDSSFMRFVKLRGGASLQDEIAIEPQITLTQRPSLSIKTRMERSEPFSIGHKTEALNVIESAPPAPIPLRKAPPTKREQALAAQKVYNGDFTQFKLPSINELTDPKVSDQTSLKRDLKRQAEVLEETLHSFNIDAKVGQINCGPTITSFEVHPSIGVKVQRIKALENDIALNMEAKSIRIIAPIPGKAAVGIEVPNPQPQEVSFKELLRTYKKPGRTFNIPMLLGKAVNGDFVMSDLTKMPHLIIAGATGSGKSVCINTIVMSVLMTARPDEVKMIMVDPKKVELTPYSNLPHMLAPVITEPQGACAALKWLVKEMESRYELFKQIGSRNIESFNERTIDVEKEQQLDRDVPKRLPFIVCIIDELADLMMVAQSDIETPIARIAQMARAVGIHLVLATQRPSREVITGLIKANFPARIAFKVASRVNSQIILDDTGAESLLGNGDMLFLPPGSSTLLRAQGAFIRDEDIAKAIAHICEQAPPNYVINSFDQCAADEKALDAIEPSDSLYRQALDIILSTGNASTTFLQRKLKIGYARAAAIIDEMEERGVVGPAEGSKPRQIIKLQGNLFEE